MKNHTFHAFLLILTRKYVGIEMIPVQQKQVGAGCSLPGPYLDQEMTVKGQEGRQGSAAGPYLKPGSGRSDTKELVFRLTLYVGGVDG